ncbi:hypothetical protein JW968_06230 [Candidatus Woesearchaeota archaeon]|nr:hypothetical protein [Candidatus Woesearchaeota archaeon]
MKHSMIITLIMVSIFLVSQAMGLFITSQYIDAETTEETGNLTWYTLPGGVERPEVEESTSFLYILFAVLIGTGLVLLLIKFGKFGIWRMWFFASVWITLVISIYAFARRFEVSYGLLGSVILALGLALWKIYRPNIYVHNLTEMFIYGGLAAIFVPLMNMFAAVMLLLGISVYDMYAVWKSKHMVTLAKFQVKSKVFAGLSIPYSLKKPKDARKHHKEGVMKMEGVRTAVLGGGDIAFPLLFTGVVMKSFGIWYALIISVVAALSLLLLLIFSQKDKFYPAMPFLSAGCFAGYGVMWLVMMIYSFML